MFVPKVARAHTINTSKLPRSTPLAQRLGGAAGEHVRIPRRGGDQDQKAGQQGAITPRAIRPVGWDFSKIPLFSPDQASRSQDSFPLPGIIQRKLAVGAVDDPLEDEADRVADQVMRTPDPDVSTAAAPLQVSRKCAACEEEEKGPTVQTKRLGAAEPAATEALPSVHEVLRSPGQPLDWSSRGFFERRFGHDFSRVRVHAGTSATAAAAAVKGRAFTAGSDIVFGRGQYAPSTIEGQRLLAHELTHVVQQTSPAAEANATPDSFAERTSPRDSVGAAGWLTPNARGEPAAAALAHATLRRDVNKDFPEAPPKTTIKPVVHPPLSKYNDSDPQARPVLVN
jgi:hypothetical protein